MTVSNIQNTENAPVNPQIPPRHREVASAYLAASVLGRSMDAANHAINQQRSHVKVQLAEEDLALEASKCTTLDELEQLFTTALGTKLAEDNPELKTWISGQLNGIKSSFATKERGKMAQDRKAMNKVLQKVLKEAKEQAYNCGANPNDITEEAAEEFLRQNLEHCDPNSSKARQFMKKYGDRIWSALMAGSWPDGDGYYQSKQKSFTKNQTIANSEESNASKAISTTMKGFSDTMKDKVQQFQGQVQHLLQRERATGQILHSLSFGPVQG